ncbi:hypothetical protein B4153_5969 [Bacillus cereus]|nr:hypothetical protein B4153_5969 [Bacillus cereus]
MRKSGIGVSLGGMLAVFFQTAGSTANARLIQSLYSSPGVEG